MSYRVLINAKAKYLACFDYQRGNYVANPSFRVELCIIY